ncbi:thiol peroxidase [Sporosarcina aquimarina]|uniref:Thiol peroxidase n=1 Tax=Sporosarcina aquimarina TaxID=114975 RepID=A0ABU4G047_9BACL|nr:thiol peroxidase [Sporosarcina aquimarina]MDW0110349.1 thiol peroxidase [Sporosarcina aquimarina]
MTPITFKNNPVTLNGKQLNAGDPAPNFTVLANDLEPVTLNDSKGKIRLISVVPSIDTGVCSKQTHRFNEEAANLGDDVEVMTISVDLPFAQSRYRSVEEIGNIQILSDHRDLSFGEAYGVAIKELRLLARAIFVVDKDDKIIYSEYVSEVTDHPDYQEALEAVEKAKA